MRCWRRRKGCVRSDGCCRASICFVIELVTDYRLMLHLETTSVMRWGTRSFDLYHIRSCSIVCCRDRWKSAKARIRLVSSRRCPQTVPWVAALPDSSANVTSRNTRSGLIARPKPDTDESRCLPCSDDVAAVLFAQLAGHLVLEVGCRALTRMV